MENIEFYGHYKHHLTNVMKKKTVSHSRSTKEEETEDLSMDSMVMVLGGSQFPTQLDLMHYMSSENLRW